MKVFIASVNQDGRTDGDERYVELRSRIKKADLGEPLERWVAEEDEPGLHTRGWRSVIDTCIHALHDADLMIVMLFRRLGTQVPIDELGPSPVTYLEMELFHAALKRVPVIFYQAKDFDPDPRLAAVISLLQRITHPRQWVHGSERDIEGRVLDDLRYMAKEGKLPPILSGFCDALSDERSFLRVREEVDSTELSFLDGYVPGVAGSVSLSRVDLLLREADAAAGGGERSYVDRLSRLWLALRDLAQEKSDRIDAQLADRWIRLCELWTSSAAWLHLHGPLELGVLATLHTRVELRDRGFIGDGEFPYGPFASEAYSIAKVSDRPDWQRRRFEAARRLATKQIERAADPSGAYGIRASATMQLALLGRRWLAPLGWLDYKRMLQTRERLGGSDSEMGEAQVELAYAEFMIGRRLPWVRRSALARLREGVGLMERDCPHLRAGFVKRGKLKFAEALAAAGLLDEAKQQRTELDDFVRRHGLPPD